MQIRFIAPSLTSGKNPFTAVGGRVYSPAAYAVLDIDAVDAPLLQANGWLVIGPVGPTASRPLPGSRQSGVPVAASHGTRYIDTDLSKEIVFDDRRQVWIDPVTGATV
jgi:hypothetical protein